MQVWRICKKQYSESAFSGKGRLNTDGRWHHKGCLIVYTSQSLSLATLESWMHIGPKDQLPHYISIAADIPDALSVYVIHEKTLSPGWNSIRPAPKLVRDLGTQWLTSHSSAVARVPAATTVGEFNYLLNPLHSDFRKIRQLEPQAFSFDPRMWKKRR